MLILKMMIVLVIWTWWPWWQWWRWCCSCWSCFLDAHDDCIHEFAEAGGDDGDDCDRDGDDDDGDDDDDGGGGDHDGLMTMVVLMMMMVMMMTMTMTMMMIMIGDGAGAVAGVGLMVPVFKVCQRCRVVHLCLFDSCFDSCLVTCIVFVAKWRVSGFLKELKRELCNVCCGDVRGARRSSGRLNTFYNKSILLGTDVFTSPGRINSSFIRAVIAQEKNEDVFSTC